MKLLKKLKKEWRYIKNYKFNWLGIYRSPFKPPKIKVYFGATRIGLPYFLPRKWDSVNKVWKIKKYFSIDIVGLGYKYKYDTVRYEWFPRISIMLFGKQLVFSFVGRGHLEDSYWEGYLTYCDETDKNLSKEERLLQLKEVYGFKYRSFYNGVETNGDDAPECLKSKYLKIWNKKS